MTNRRNGTIYVGVTNNIQRRIFEHKNKLVDGFSKKYGLDKLVYFEEFSDIKDAISAEKTIKGWTRKRKLYLIEKSNSNWNDLSLDSSLRSE